jgi:hypothetical protein
MRVNVAEAQRAGGPISGALLVSFQPSAPSQVQLLSDRGTAPIRATMSTTWTRSCSYAAAMMPARRWFRGKNGRSLGWKPGG